jgi:hypothetical protein
VAAPAAVEVEARAEAVADALLLVEVVLAGLEQRELPAGWISPS